jgi:nitrite reductase (NADH) large subunit
LETGVTESFKKKLIVIGNGMAGARTVEEILARGGADQFEITVVGEEAYGNYNRLLLSSVLNGSQDPSEIFLTATASVRKRSCSASPAASELSRA